MLIDVKRVNGGATFGSADAAERALDRWIENPPFDPRIISRPMTVANAAIGPKKANLYRGFIRQSKDYKPVKSAARVKLNFLYNPSIISASHSIDTGSNGLLPAFARPDDPSVAPLLPLNSNVTFDLLFDRTFEMWDRSKINSYVGKRGVFADIEVLYDLVGMYDQLNLTDEQKSKLGESEKGLGDKKYIGVMQYVPVLAFIGSQSRSVNALTYNGVITSLSLSYTHFSQDMIPFRAAVSVSMQLLPKVG